MPALKNTKTWAKSERRLRRRKPGQPPLSLFRAEGRRRRLQRCRRRVPLHRGRRDRPCPRPSGISRRGRRSGDRRADRRHRPEPQGRHRRRDPRIHRHVSGHGAAPRATKASTRSPTGSRPSPRPRRATPAASRRRWTRSGSNPLCLRWRRSRASCSDDGTCPCCHAPRADARDARGLCHVHVPWSIAMSREGSLDAPTRASDRVAGSDDFYDPAKLDAEMRRVFDICHGCRRCFNLCDSFPRLFDLIDNGPTEEVDGVKSEDFTPVVEACTLCDMCFMTKCPYVPPHPFNARFPASDAAPPRRRGEEGQQAISPSGSWPRWTATARWRALASPLVNWASDKSNTLTRPLMEKVAGIDRTPSCRNSTAADLHVAPTRASRSQPNPHAPAFGKRKAALYATCFVNYNKPDTGMAARAVLNHIGVETTRRLSRLLRHAVPGAGRARRAWPNRRRRSPRNWSS